eukprot:jgi/Mesvir1/18215/Mv09494-RA.1
MGQSIRVRVPPHDPKCGCKTHVFVDCPTALAYISRKSPTLGGAIVECGSRAGVLSFTGTSGGVGAASSSSGAPGQDTTSIFVPAQPSVVEPVRPATVESPTDTRSDAEKQCFGRIYPTELAPECRAFLNEYEFFNVFGRTVPRNKRTGLAQKSVADARDWVAGNKLALDNGASLLKLAEKEVLGLRSQLAAAKEEARASATASLAAAGPSSSTGIMASVARHTLELEREKARAVAEAEERTLAVHNKTIEVETARMKAADAAAAAATAQARLVDARVEELRETLRVQQLEHQKATAVARAEEQRTIQRQDEQASQLAIREMETRGRHECCMARARFFREQSQQGVGGQVQQGGSGVAAGACRSGTDTPPPNGDEYTFCSKAMVDEVVDIVTVTPVSPLPGQSIPSDNVVDGFVPTGFVLDERATQRMGRELTHTERIIFETELRSLYLRAGIPFPEPMRQMEGGPSRYMCYTHHMYLFDEAVSRMPWMWHSAPAAAAPAAPAPPAAPVPSAPVASVAATPSAAAGSADGTVGRDAPAAPEQGREKRVKLE